VVLGDKAGTYDLLEFFFLVIWLLFLKNLDIFLTSLGVFTGIGGGNLVKLIGLLFVYYFWTWF